MRQFFVRLKSDRERQREVARKRLEELKRRRGGVFTISEEDADILRSDDRDALEVELCW